MCEDHYVVSLSDVVVIVWRSLFCIFGCCSCDISLAPYDCDECCVGVLIDCIKYPLCMTVSLASRELKSDPLISNQPVMV